MTENNLQPVHSFDPVIDEQASILILGSMPGEESLRKQQYYANPRNHFWTMLYSIFDKSFEEDYEKRLAFLKSKRIALWDVIGQCIRPGSLDSSITEEQVNDFTTLYHNYPNIRYVLLNGTKAYDTYLKKVGKDDNKTYVKLPSSSPTPGRNVKSLEEKIEAWRVIKDWTKSTS
ncbi:DNA-deoxyinosine glycosylase [Marinicrinis lubricantis]|uniref:DNA-deoxyinosine glycosylase n=1 Tax=Marinicrinis lubricantis TaxID=2086470 RepID=A0ABW1IRF8_9BACL